MARLIFEKALIAESTNTDNNIEILGIVTDSVSMTEEALQVIIEDNQNINEGYTTTLSFRTRDLNDVSGDPIIDSSANTNATLIYAGGENVLGKRNITMVGINGGANYTISNVYTMGRRVYENGRDEIEISCQIDSTGTKITRA